jgi:hypothetical protein
MKILSFLLLIATIIVSCKKDSRNTSPQPKTNVKKYAVKFSVAQFAETVGPITGSIRNLAIRKNNAAVTDTTTLAKQVIEYYYLVYDSQGNEIRRIYRTSTSPQTISDYHAGSQYSWGGVTGLRYYDTTDPYNVLTDSLAAGTYTIVFTGDAGDRYNSGININNNDTDFNAVELFSLLPQAIIYAGQGLDPEPVSMDLFFSKTTLVVGNQNTTASITMNRVVGQVQVVLQDAIPANVAYLNITRQNEDGGFRINTATSTSPVENEDDDGNLLDPGYDIITSSETGKAGLSFCRYIWNTATPVTITLQAVDKNGHILFTKTIPDVTFYQNRRTILTGKLFNNTSTTQFTITANQAWGADGPTIQF